MPIYKDNSIRTTTWANRGNAADNSGRLIYVSDVGPDGSTWYSNGSVWVNESSLLLQKGVKGWIVPSLLTANAATYSQSGTVLTVVSAAHTLTAMLNGSDVYLIIGTVSTGVAPTAPTYAGWFTNFTYVDANTFTCTAGNSQTGTGFVNSNIAETTITELTKTIQGGLLGPTGVLSSILEASGTNTAGSKIITQRLNNFIYSTSTLSTTAIGYRSYASIQNTTEASQKSFTTISSGWGGTGGVLSLFSINTAVDVTNTIIVQTSVANQYAAITSLILKRN